MVEQTPFNPNRDFQREFHNLNPKFKFEVMCQALLGVHENIFLAIYSHILSFSGMLGINPLAYPAQSLADWENFYIKVPFITLKYHLLHALRFS